MEVLGESREGVSQGLQLLGWGSLGIEILRNCSAGLGSLGKGRQKEMSSHGWGPREMGVPGMGSGWVARESQLLPWAPQILG